MTVYDDNPAGRLHKLITAFAHSASQHKIGITWAAVLGMPEQPTADLFARFARVYALPDEVEAEMARLLDDDEAEYDPDMAMRWRDPVRAAFGISLFSDQNSADIVNNFGPRTLDSLENCSFVLHRYRSQPAVPDSEIARLNNLIEQMKEEIIAADEEALDTELCNFLLYHANLMASAIRDIGISGNAVLERAYDQSVGAMIRRKDLLAQAKETKEKKSAWDKWLTILTAVSVALNITTSALVLPGQIRQELEGPAPQPAIIVKIEPPNPSAGTAPESSVGASSVSADGGESSSGAASP